jgi:hypothetical protein
VNDTHTKKRERELLSFSKGEEKCLPQIESCLKPPKDVKCKKKM